jgi:AbrB family looped-hinge helix DNA binding protein
MKMVKIDKHGRIVVPAKIRKNLKSDKFGITVKDGIIELKPVEGLDSLFGSLSELDMKRIRKEHEEEDEHFTG